MKICYKPRRGYRQRVVKPIGSPIVGVSQRAEGPTPANFKAKDGCVTCVTKPVPTQFPVLQYLSGLTTPVSKVTILHVSLNVELPTALSLICKSNTSVSVDQKTATPTSEPGRTRTPGSRSLEGKGRASESRPHCYYETRRDLQTGLF